MCIELQGGKTNEMKTKMRRRRLPGKFSGWFFLRAMANKIGKKNPKEVTAEDLHKFGHSENTIFDDKHPDGERFPPLFDEQLDLDTAKEIVRNPDRIWESR